MHRRQVRLEVAEDAVDRSAADCAAGVFEAWGIGLGERKQVVAADVDADDLDGVGFW